jgi:hypothetical protein
VGQNTGLTILAPVNSNGNGEIPLLSNFNSTIATAFTGLLAEVRVYTNATVSGTALSAYLQNSYAQIPTISLAATGPAAAPVGGTVNLQVSIPAAASQNGPFTVTLTSSNLTVLASTNILFSTGTTTVDVSVPVLGVGSANIAASGTGLQSSSSLAITGYPAGTIIPVTWFKADAISGATNGSGLAVWNDSSGNGYNATQTAPGQEPVYVTNAMNGLPVVRFNSDNSTSMSFTRPVQDDFTMVCVFQSTQGLNSGSLYYQGAGLVNGEVAGVINDFGACLFANGSVAAGTGNPDVAVDSAPGYNDGKPHIMTFTRTESLGLISLYMDGALVGTTTGGTESMNAPSVLVLGAQQTQIYYLSGDIAEVQIYNSALSGTNLQSAEGPLFQKYNIPPPAPAGLYLQLENGQIVLNWTGSIGAVDYEILRATAAGGPYAIISTNTTTTFIDASASQTNIYYYEVAAVGGGGQAGTATTAVSTTTILNTHEPLGPSSRTTPIAISEIMWKPAPRTDGKDLEYLELYNSNPWFQDIGGYQLVCADMNYTFPAGTTIASNGFIVVAAAPADVESVYGITNVMGPYTGSLKHSETLELLDEQSNVLLTVPYTDVYPWPVATDETGHSLILAKPSYGEGDPRAWDISTFAGGSPGTADVYPDSPYKVVINEILPHSENPAVPQFIELYNHSGQTNDISGCILTDDPTTNKFVIPPGTVMGPASFVSFTQPQFGFTLNGEGDTLYLISPNGTRILDAVQFGAQPDGISYGRWPDGANDFYNFTTNTPGTGNGSILIGDIVINELMYDPISGNDDDQYIELYNKGANTVNLNGWQFTSGVTFTFPNVTIAPNGYLVVARNTANLFAHYSNLNSGNTVGNFSGKLSHNGELVALSQPESYYGTNTIYVEEDQVAYGTGGRWGEWAGGGGSSLELIDPHSNHRLASNWADSDESQKSSWTNIVFTGTLDNGFNYDSSIDYAEFGILDSGECLVDNVIVKDANGVNYVSNSTFETGTSGWAFQGDHVRSSLESSGYQSNYSLHVRASDHYFNGDDSCEVALNPNNFASGQTATLGFEARWIHGWPEAVLRLSGGWLEATGPLPVPTNLGTPGMPNSAYVTNAGPALYNVTHSPALPAANQPVVVTASVSDPDGVTNLTLYYRLDPATTYTAVPMKDDGTGGDEVWGDGVFSATIPGQPMNTLAAYYISASDSLGAATRFPALLTDNTPVRECLVLFGDGNPGGCFGVYHLWLTQTNVTRWANLGNESNEGIDCTMVYANRVIYNAQAHYAGSPVHQYYDTPNGTLCSYKWIFPDDDKFLGATDFNKIHNPGNTGNDPTYQREQLANTFLRALGVPWLNRRDVVVYVNGNRRGPIMEDAQTPGSDYVKEYFPNDSDGYLYKIARWYEFGPFDTGYSMPDNLASECMILPYTTTGGAKKVARYRWIFENRRTPDSENNYSNVFSMIDAASTHGTSGYVSNMESQVNMENWMRVFAANHAAGNWDAFGSDSGQNLYPYVGTQGTKWTLFMFDFNIGLGIDGSYPPGQDLFTTLSGDSNMAGIYNEPTFLRMYWRALSELVSVGPLNLSLSVPLLNAKYAALQTTGQSIEDPNLNLIPWITQAAPEVAAQVNAANAASFSVNSGATITNGFAYLTGQAPFNVNTIVIDGSSYTPAWTTVTGWTLAVPLQNGTNVLNLTGFNRSGQAIAGDTNTISVVYTGVGAPPLDHIVYSQASMVYTQNFDSLPDPGAISVNTTNPVTINGVTYFLANPYCFGEPIGINGNTGGLGLPAMAGWYGSSVSLARFGATDGDQTTGGQLSFGSPNSSNRALGLLATSTTDATAFGVKFVNGTTSILNEINVQLTGEVWRQSNLPKTLQFYYFVDSSDTSTFPPSASAFIPALNVTFPTVAAYIGGNATNGTLAVNQSSLGVANQVITSWLPNAALWLVWQMTDSTGKAQGLGIDNLSFSASVVPANVPLPPLVVRQSSGANFTISCSSVTGLNYQLQYNNNLGTTNWVALGGSVPGTGNLLSFSINATNAQRFFRVQILP